MFIENTTDSFLESDCLSYGPLRRVIDEARRANGLSLGDLTVLGTQNDPYRCDTPAGHRNAGWVAEQFKRTGRRRLHVRGLHYSIVARGDVIKPNGEIYVNDEPSWTWLQATAVKAARWLGYVPFAAITDERNSPPIIHRRKHEEPETWVSVGIRVHIPDADDLQPTACCDDFVGRQPYHLVIVGEKSSLEEVVLPIARRFQADLYLPTGEISDTLVYQIAADAAEDGRPLRVFYLSDFDPSGYEMPANVGRKLQALRDLEFTDLDFECRSVALTYDQVRELGLPSTPLKETERRGDRWRAAWGVEQTEIDALATLQPFVLDEIVTKALEPFFDDGLSRRAEEAQDEWLDEAQGHLDERVDQDLLDELRRQAVQKLDELRREVDELNKNIRLATDDQISLPTAWVPEAEIDPTSHGKPIVSSAWDWVDQTEALIDWKSYGDGDLA